MRIYYICIVFWPLWLLSASLFAQDKEECPCLEDECGDILSDFAIEGDQSVVCDGYRFDVTNNTDVGNITEYIWYWGDGTMDVTTTKTNVSHVYNIPDSLVCSDDKTNYMICLVIVRKCGDGGISCHSTSKPVGVIHRPRAFFTVPEENCVNTPLMLTNQSCNAESFVWRFGDGTTSSEEMPLHTYDTPGRYTVTLEAYNDCNTDTYTRTIEVLALPEANFAFEANPTDFCGPTVVQFGDRSNEWSHTRWEIIPNDTNYWRFTDTLMNLATDDIEVRFLQSGEYNITLNATNICGESTQQETIEILQPPSITLESPGTFCDAKTISAAELNFSTSGSIDQYSWSFENGTPASFMGESFPPVTFTQSGTITLRVNGPCGALTRSVPITIATTEPITLGDNPAEVCQNQDPIQLLATPAGGIWSAAGIPNETLSPDGRLDPRRLSPGNYTIQYSTGAAECPNSETFNLRVLAPVSVNLPDVPPACETLTFSPQPNYGGEIDTYRWTFMDGAPATSTAPNPGPVSFNTPGRKTVIVEVSGACGTASDTVLIDIQQNVNLVIEPLPGPLCSGSAPYTLMVNTPGGTWAGTGITNAQLGVFDPSAVTPDRTYSITYTLENGACRASESIDVEVVSSQIVTVQPDIFCIDSDARPIEVNATGGEWSGPGIDPASGRFDPAITGVGDHPIEYSFTDPNGCSVTASAQITVEDRPQLSMRRDTVELCLSAIDVDIADALNYTPDPAGGTTVWSGPGITDGNQGIFNAGNLTEGVYTLFVQYDRNDCSVLDSARVQVILARELALTPDTVLCITDDFFQLESNLGGGVWSGPGVDPATGRIDLRATGDGAFRYSYSYQPGTSCAQSGETTVEIIDLSQIVEAGPDIEICDGPNRIQLLGAMPNNGYWRGPELVDTSTGILDLRDLQRDTNYVYYYCIESTQVEGCEACASRTFRINSNPTAGFAINGNACAGETIGLRNTSENAVKYTWDFGDGSTANSTFEPTHVYAQKNTYTIELEVESDRGCKSYASREVYVTTTPTADFFLAENEGCAPFELQITNRSFGDDITQEWHIGGDTISGADPGRIFLDNITRDSNFQIVLAVSNLCGEVRDEESVLVHPYPIVRFGISDDEGCSPLEVEFSNTTLGNPETYRWNLGNNTSVFTDSLPPNQIYTTTDTSITIYTVSLISTNECGVDTLVKDITVYPPDVKAFIERDTLGGCSPLTLQLESYSTPGARVSWRFVDEQGRISGSEEENPVITFSEPGRHTVILYASNCGTDTDTTYIDVLPAPEVKFDHPPYVCLGQAIVFENQSTNISGSDWDFGDGDQSTLNSPAHRYDSAGIYSVSLTAYSLVNNCPSVYESEVEVVGLPTAAFTPDRTNGCGPLDIQFNNESSGAGQLRYAWDFDDDTSNNLTRSPSHHFEEPGNYVVSLIVYDDNGCFADTAVANVIVFPDPNAGFSFPEQNYCLGYDEVALNNTSADAVRYQWLFQGDTLTERAPVLTPRRGGRHAIELTVENTFGCSDRQVREIEILESPIAEFTISAPSGCEDIRINFLNNSQHSDFYEWNFGNGNVSTDPSPAHTFLDDGRYVIVLRASAANGCPSDTARAEVVVYPKPTADFAFDNPRDCGAPAEVVFTNRSIGALDHSWDLGDGATTDVTSPVHTYTGIGEFPIRLEVANEYGCRDTSVQTIDIFGRPLADFDVSVGEGCHPLTVQLDNLSMESTRFIWRIETLGETDAADPQVVFPNPGAYDIELVAIYNDQCKDSIRLPDAVRVYRSPQANFRYEADQAVNLLGDVQFYNESDAADRYRWDLGDGTATAIEAPYHEYAINRSIDVTLYAFNDNGGVFTCVDSLTLPVDPEWIKTFYAPNAFAPDYGEGKVREFRPVGIGLLDYQISVYSPWGQQVWYSTAIDEEEQPAEAWNGRLNNEGSPVPQGTYVWIAEITFVDGTKRRETGTVTVLR